MKAVSLVGVRHAFRGAQNNAPVPVLDGVALQVAPGELVALLGPSGCGKTTILHLVAGMLKADAGQVTCGGSPVQDVSPERVMVFQDGALFPWLTVAQNVAFGAGKKPIQPWIDALGLTGAEARYPKELSGGMRQRTALARALVVEPDVLLLDEPFAALDAISRERLHEVLESAWLRTQPTTLLVTHSVDEALRLADRIFVMAPRPTRVRESFVVDAPRPRDPALLAGLRKAIVAALPRD